MIEDITVRFREAIYGEPSSSKMFLYSGHDVSLHSLSKVLGLPIDFSPYFGSSLIFEVHRLASTDFRIRVYINLSKIELLRRDKFVRKSQIRRHSIYFHCEVSFIPHYSV